MNSQLFRRAVLACMLAAALAAAPALPAQNAPAAQRHITGTVKSAGAPLPGVSVSAAHSLTGRRTFTSTDLEGGFSLTLPGNGRYVVRAELSAFATATQEVVLNAENPQATLELELVLLSRVAPAPDQPAGDMAQQLQSVLAAGQGFQSLGLTQGEGGLGMMGAGGGGAGMEGMMPGMGADMATESLSVGGSMGRTEGFAQNVEQLEQRIREFRERNTLMGGGGGGTFTMGGGGGISLAGGGPGGGGGPGAVMIMMRPGGRGGGFNVNRIQGNAFFNYGGSVLDARPYSLTGIPADKPSYNQNRFGVFLGGPFKVPGIYNGEGKTFFFGGYTGALTSNPFNTFATVPTDLERAGDFSQTVIRSGPNAGQPVVLINPATGLPYAGNIIPPGDIHPAAAGLLRFFPQANQPGQAQNFHRVTSANSDFHTVMFRVNHSLGTGSGQTQAQPGQRAGGQRRGGGFPFSRNSINAGFTYRTGSNDIRNYSPLLGGKSENSGLNASFGYVRGWGRVTNRFSFQVNRNRTEARNLYAFREDVAGDLGITGVSADPFDWGPPSLTFTGYNGLRDLTPQLRTDFSWAVNDFISWTRGRHNLRMGGDFRRSYQQARANSDPRGSFVFTGFATAEQGAGGPVPGTGHDFADFLLGTAQQTSIQFGGSSYRFRGNTWSLFFQDDWRLHRRLSLNLGLRYEYASPLTERDGQLVNLDAAPGFTAVAPVFPGGSGPFTGVFPASLVEPDRNNFAPRVGLAWNFRDKLVVRAGYGIHYNSAAYNSFVQQMAVQPPFAVTATNIAAPGTPLTLESGFPPPGGDITNNYAVQRDYRLGYVQSWNLDVQREIVRGLVLNAAYTGAKGTGLDIVRAPNRGPDGLRIPGVQSFLWQSSEGASTLHAGNLRLRRRMSAGVSVGGSYTYSQSIDNASSIGGGATVVAQNDLDLAAERGLSSFHQRHRFSSDYMVELPFGQNKRWLTREGLGQRLLGSWIWSGSVVAASGSPFTARVLGDFRDVSRGTFGTLRADATGQPISVSNPTAERFFNTAAFTLPQPGQFGSAGRNTILGPGSWQVDMSVSRSMVVAESRTLEIRAQAFNVFNHASFSRIDTAVNSPSYGQVTAAGNMRRLQLMARLRF